MRPGDVTTRCGPASVVVAALASLMLCAAAFAQSGASVEARIESQPVFVGQPFQFTIEVSGDQPAEPPDLSSVPEGIDVGTMSTGQYTSMSVINGQMRSVSTRSFTFDMVVNRPGTYRIPPIPVRVGGKTLQTREVRFNAGTAPESDYDQFHVEIEIDNTTPYVGEPVTLTLRLYAKAGFRVPTFSTAGDFDAFDSADVPGWSGDEEPWSFLGGQIEPKTSRSVVRGQVVLVVELARRLIPLEAGDARLGPITVSTELLRVVDDWPFRRRRSAGTVSAHSEAIDLHVRPVPTEGKPAGFTGLIGRYNLHTEADPTDVSVGDPIQLHVLVTGGPRTGDLPAPALGSLPGFRGKLKVSGEEPEQQSAAGGVVFTYHIRALDDSVDRIPAVELPYFDSERGEYGVARSEPIRIHVRPTRTITAADAVGTAPVSSGSDVGDVSRGIAFNYEDADALAPMPTSVLAELRSPVWIASIATPPVFYAACALAIGVRRRGESRSAMRRRSRALSEAASRLRRAASVDDVVAGVSLYFEMVTGRRGASLTPRDCEALAAPVSEAGAERLHALLERCDAVRYAGSNVEDVRALGEEASAVLKEIDPGMRRARR